MTLQANGLVVSISSCAALLLAACAPAADGEAVDPRRGSAVVEEGLWDVAFIDDLTLIGGGDAAAITDFAIAVINTGSAPLGLPDLRITPIGDDHPASACDFGLSETPPALLAAGQAAWIPSDLGMPLLAPLLVEPRDERGARMFVLVENLGDGETVTCRARLEIAGRSADLAVTIHHQAAPGAAALRYDHARRVSAAR